MNRPLVGWDLATWRVSQSGAGLKPNIICIAEISGIVPIEEIRGRVARLAEHDERLCSTIIKNELVKIENLNLKEAVFQSDESVQNLAQRFLKQGFGEGERLWYLGIVYTSSKTFLVSLINHAIADGNQALKYLKALFDDFELARDGYAQSQNTNNDANASQFDLGNLFRRVASDPVGLITDINSLVTSSGKMLPDLFNQIHSKSKVDSIFEIVGIKISTLKLNELAELHSVKTHDVLMGIALSLFEQMDLYLEQQDRDIVVNVPVAFNAGPLAANQILVARLRFPIGYSSFEEVIKMSRQKLQNWRREPALKLAPKLLNLVHVVSDENLSTLVASSDLTVSTLRDQTKPSTIAGCEVAGIWPIVNPLGAAMNFTALVGNEHTRIGVCLDVTKFKADTWQFKDNNEVRKLNSELYFFEQIFE